MVGKYFGNYQDTTGKDSRKYQEVPRNNWKEMIRGKFPKIVGHSRKYLRRITGHCQNNRT